jgi:hypothetical protein
VVRDYRRVDDSGVSLRKPKYQPRRKEKRSRAQRAAEYRYQKTAKCKAKSKVQAARRRARKLDLACPLTPTEHLRIIALYAEAARRTAETGIAHHVDHDRPLALGGLHHPDNMLVVPADINLAKGARYASTLEFILS